MGNPDQERHRRQRRWPAARPTCSSKARRSRGRAQIDPAEGHTVVDATGLLVMPGGVDVHTHLDMPFGGTVSADDYRTGTMPRPSAARPPSSTSSCSHAATPWRCARNLAGQEPTAKPASTSGCTWPSPTSAPATARKACTRWKTWCAKGITSLQALHGLPQRADDRRWH